MKASDDKKILWIISGDHPLVNKIKEQIDFSGEQVEEIDSEEVEREHPFSSLRERKPDLIILDIDNQVDRGLQTIREIRRARIKAPFIVITSDFSREFGAKIVSEGVRYYFSRDYCVEEFQEVVRILLGKDSLWPEAGDSY